MALSGTVNSSSYEGRYIQLTWSATQSVANNTSTISWELKGAGTGQAGWYMAGGFKVVINGDTVYSKSTDYRIQLYNGTQVASGTKTISHNSDGSKSFSISIQAGIYTYAVNCTGSKSFTLNTIPRASSISWGSGTSSVAGITNGTNINISRASSSFTHTITYRFGSASGTVCAKTTATNVKWTIPLSLLNQIPNATSGTGTMTCTTYSGSTAIGTSTLGLTVTAPGSVKPTINSASVSIDNSANSIIAGWGLYVAGYSKARITAAASGAYGSTVSSFTISGGYSITQSGSSLSYTGGKFTSSGSKTFNVVAKDSRGRASDTRAAGTITVYAYSNPTISALSVKRSSTNHTEETREKMRQNHYDMTGENNPFYNKHHSNETIQHLSYLAKQRDISHLNTPFTEERRLKIGELHGKIIQQFDLDMNLIYEFPSMRALESIGYRRASIRDVCSGRKDSYKGFIWKYKNPCDNNESGYKPGVGSDNIYCTDEEMNLISVYKSYSEASRKTGVTRKQISKSCNSERHLFGKYNWFLKDDYEKLKEGA